MRYAFALPLAASLLAASPLCAQSVLFNFENATLYMPFPLDLTVGGITAHFTGTGAGYSIQNSATVGQPVGFSGKCVFPSGGPMADIIVSYSKPLTAFSILYATYELDCDCSSTVKVTAYMDATVVGSNTMSAVPGGVWPSATLSFSSTTPFNKVVVHYLQGPQCPQCDYGPMIMADNMQVTPAAGPPADLNGDTHVNAADLAILLGAWGTNNPAADLNGDGVVGGADLATLLGAWTG